MARFAFWLVLLLPSAHLAAQTPVLPLGLKGFIKPGGPPAVTVQLQPMENGRLNLVLSFYRNNSGKMERLAYSGQLRDIEQQIQADVRLKQVPARLQDLVEVALIRVRTINQNQN